MGLLGLRYALHGSLQKPCAPRPYHVAVHGTGCDYWPNSQAAHLHCSQAAHLHHSQAQPTQSTQVLSGQPHVYQDKLGHQQSFYGGASSLYSKVYGLDGVVWY